MFDGDWNRPARKGTRKGPTEGDPPLYENITEYTCKTYPHIPVTKNYGSYHTHGLDEHEPELHWSCQGQVTAHVIKDRPDRGF